MLKFGFKRSLKPNAFSKTQFKTEVMTILQFETEVSPGNPVLNGT